MSEYSDAAIARVGADRMALGLSCIPNKIYGDVARVRELEDRIERAEKQADMWEATAGHWHKHAEAAEAKVARVEALPEKWLRSNITMLGCVNELEAALQEPKE